MNSLSSVLPTAGASLLAGFVVMLAFALGTWLVSVAKRDVSIVDAVWSLMLLAGALTYALIAPGVGERAAWVLALTAVWALRLSGHIIWRGWGEPEDHRYQAIRARNQPGFAWKSVYLVFVLQAVLAWIVSVSLYASASGQAAMGWLDVAGLLLVASGILYLVNTASDQRQSRENGHNARCAIFQNPKPERCEKFMRRYTPRPGLGFLFFERMLATISPGSSSMASRSRS